MVNQIPISEVGRLSLAIDLAWKLFFERVVTGRTVLNKESSMQLHYSSVLSNVGDFFCVMPGETFTIELESSHGRSNIDITCGFSSTRAALELKCFRKKSNRAIDTDMYDVWKDISRLSRFESFKIKRFICLTDNPYYLHGKHGGYSETFSTAQGLRYKKDDVLTPGWAGRWKEKSRDHPLTVPKDIEFSWTERDNWFYLFVDL